MIIWQTEVSPLQFFGYSIALAGIVHYKLGTDTLKGYAAEAGRSWAEFGAQKPVRRQIVIMASVFSLLVVVLWAMGPYAAESGAARALTNAANRVVGSS